MAVVDLLNQVVCRFLQTAPMEAENAVRTARSGLRLRTWLEVLIEKSPLDRGSDSFGGDGISHFKLPWQACCKDGSGMLVLFRGVELSALELCGHFLHLLLLVLSSAFIKRHAGFGFDVRRVERLCDVYSNFVSELGD
jgi:hypothetical protein